MIQCSDYIAQRLKEHGVEHVFMVSGGGAMYLNNSLGKTFSYTANHHEQACAIAAEGYTRVSSKLAVVNVTTGPGGLNCLNGLFGQWTDSVPVLYISGQVKRSTMNKLYEQQYPMNHPLRQLGDQEVDIISVVRPLTKYAVCVTDEYDIKYHIDRAIHEATTGRLGPVWLDIPIDIQTSTIDERLLKEFTPDIPKNPEIPYDAIITTLCNAKRPLIIAGHGIRLSHTQNLLSSLLDLTTIPVVTTLNGFDLVNEQNPQYMGRIGTIGQRSGNFVLQNADCILCLGTRNNIRQISYAWENFAKNAYKIVVDIDKAELEKPLVQPDLPVCADLHHFMPSLLTHLEKYPHLSSHIKEWQPWLEFCHTLKNKFSFSTEKSYVQEGNLINVYYFIHTLIASLQNNDICVLANATPTICTFQTGIVADGQRYISNSGCASMGYALPASIGASYVRSSKRNVVCIEGDGSIMMNLQELQTIKHNDLPITIFVINNNGYSSIKQTQSNFFNGHLTASDPSSGVSFPSFIDIGKAFGLHTIQIQHPDEMITTIQEALNAQEPTLCEVLVNPEYIFTPKLASRKLDDGTMLSSSLEDMYPFLDVKDLQECMLYDTLSVMQKK